MPMYSFVCRECGQPFDKKLPMSQSGETQACPACGSLETRKSIGAVAVGGMTGSGSSIPLSVRPPSSPFS